MQEKWHRTQEPRVKAKRRSAGGDNTKIRFLHSNKEGMNLG